MRCTTLFTTIVASAVAVHAGAGTACRNVGFNNCFDLSFPGNFQCVNLGGDKKDTISSFAITPGYACRFYDTNNCKDDQGNLDNQRGSVSDLRNYAGGWNDRISSYLCTLV